MASSLRDEHWAEAHSIRKCFYTLWTGSGRRREAIWNCESVTGYLRASVKRTVGVVRIGVGACEWLSEDANRCRQARMAVGFEEPFCVGFACESVSVRHAN